MGEPTFPEGSEGIGYEDFTKAVCSRVSLLKPSVVERFFNLWKNADEKIEKHHWEEMDKCIETLLRLSGSFHNKYKGAEGMAMIGREKYDTEEFEKKKMLLKGLENEKEHPKDEQ